MIDEEQLKLERAELVEVNQRGFGARFVYYARRSGPGWLQGAITLGGGSLAGALYLGGISGYSMMLMAFQFLMSHTPNTTTTIVLIPVRNPLRVVRMKMV